MEDISYFFKMLEKSTISLLNYSFKDEIIKDKIISKIPHINIKEIGLSFSFKPYLRNEYLNSILEKNSNIKWFILDTNEISPIKNVSRSYQIESALNEITKSSIFLSKTPFKLLILSSAYRSSTNIGIHNFNIGSRPIYMCDFISTISSDPPQNHPSNNYLEVIKNRHDNNKNISLDNLIKYDFQSSILDLPKNI